MTKQFHKYFTILLCAGTAGLALPATAQDAENKRPDRPRADQPRADQPRADQPRGDQPRPDRARPQPGGLLRALDRNGNGVIDESEIDMAIVSLKTLDKNKDGKLTRDELGAPGRDRASRPDRPGTASSNNPDRPRLGLPNFAEMDANKDGKLSKDELPERMQERFARMDRSGDGFLDKEEQEIILKFIRQRMRDGGAGNNQRRPDRDDGQGGSVKPKRPAVDGGDKP